MEKKSLPLNRKLLLKFALYEMPTGSAVSYSQLCCCALQDASILLSTHLIADVEQLLDDVIFLKDGQIILSSSVEEIRDTRHQSVDSYFREVFSCSQN